MELPEFETNLNSVGLFDFAAKANELRLGLLEIKRKYDPILQENKIVYETQLSICWETETLKIKPNQENLPIEMQKEILEYFRSKLL
ncbi:MAG TPA: hypothetical protein VHB48_12530 [Chitinophagaceae bacterium]|nr:hypothetical protein [Chitinophagaceae bacterium]